MNEHITTELIITDAILAINVKDAEIVIAE